MNASRVAEKRRVAPEGDAGVAQRSRDGVRQDSPTGTPGHFLGMNLHIDDDYDSPLVPGQVVALNRRSRSRNAAGDSRRKMSSW